MTRLLVALLALISVASLGTAQESETFRSWNQPFAPFRVAGNVYYVGASDIASYLIPTAAGHVLLDGGFAETAPIIRANVAALGFDLDQVKILLNTHAHLDHAGGLAELQRESGARLLVMEGDAEVVASGAWNAPEAFRFPPARVDHVLQDREQVRLGGTVLTAYHTPGHTRGNTTWTLRVDEGGRQLLVVVAGSPTVLPETRLTGSTAYPEVAADYEKSFRVLRDLDCDVFLAGHGSFFGLERKARELAGGGTANPFIDPAGYRPFVTRTEKAFRDRWRAEKRAVRSRAD